MPQVAERAAGPVALIAPAGAGAEQLRLFDSGVDVAALRIERAAITERRLSVNTRRAYRADWADFLRWCDSAGRAPLPASTDTVCLYLVGQARAEKLVATIERRCSSIAFEHLRVGARSPINEDVREVLYGLRRKLGVAPVNAKVALSVDDLRAVLRATPEDVWGVRDRAVLLLGFASGLRRSELSALDLASVRFEPAGLVVTVARSKTDQEGLGREVGVHRGRHRLTDPVGAVTAWIRERGNWPGPLFPIIDVNTGAISRRRVSGHGLAEVVQSAVKRAGLDPARYGGHSLRAGCATAAAANGASDLAIMRRTGHSSVAMVGRYVRHASVFAVDPLAGVL
jgi:integrase